MQDTATIIAHILFRHGSILNLSMVLRNLDLTLDRASNGAYSLNWDSEDLMVAEFSQTKVILVAGHQIAPKTCFSLTIAISPKDADAIPNPTLSTLHNCLIQELVARFEEPQNISGVLWQRASAPITAEAVERIAEALSERLALMDGVSSKLPLNARNIETAQMIPTASLTLQSRPILPI